ncbi:LIMR family protein At5g01460 [Linum perenne]
MGDFNLALIIVAIVVCVIVFIFNVYLLVNYQHPDDKNQAYFPKVVVVFGLSIAVISILMLPADVANRQACRHAIYNGACNLTLPMKDLWMAVYIIDAVLVFFIIPFAMFYYEGDQDKTVGKRVKSALKWVIATAIVCALLLGILYGLAGKVDFTVRHLTSTTTNFPTSWNLSPSQPCIGNNVHQSIMLLGLLGTAAFAFFCFYLLLAVVAGSTMLGLRIVFITIHPMKWGATLMNSFLFNVGLILLCSISVIQFCATAFGYYAQATAAQEIFGHTLQSLRGIKYLYKYNVFQIAFISLAGLTFVYYAAFGWKRKKPSGRFQLSS